MTENVDEKPKSTEERIADYLKSIATIDATIEPYKEQRKELRKGYVDNNWLTKEQIKDIMIVYRLRKNGTNFQDLSEMQKKIVKMLGD